MLCMYRQSCLSPFAECVTEKLQTDAGTEGIEVFFLGTLDHGENPRDAAMVDVTMICRSPALSDCKYIS